LLGCNKKIAPVINLTGTNMFIRGTTQFRADARISRLLNKKTFIFHFLILSISNQFWHICGLLSSATFCKMWDSKHL